MQSSRGKEHSSADSEASPSRLNMNVSQKMQIRDYIRKQNAKEKTHRNFKSEIPPLFEHKTLDLGKEAGLSEFEVNDTRKTPRMFSSPTFDA